MTVKHDKVAAEMDRYLAAMHQQNKEPSYIALTKRQFDDLDKGTRDAMKYKGYEIRVIT